MRGGASGPARTLQRPPIGSTARSARSLRRGPATTPTRRERSGQRSSSTPAATSIGTNRKLRGALRNSAQWATPRNFCAILRPSPRPSQVPPEVPALRVRVRDGGGVEVRPGAVLAAHPARKGRADEVRGYFPRSGLRAQVGHPDFRLRVRVLRTVALAAAFPAALGLAFPAAIGPAFPAVGAVPRLVPADDRHLERHQRNLCCTGLRGLQRLRGTPTSLTPASIDVLGQVPRGDLHLSQSANRRLYDTRLLRLRGL